MEHVDAMATVYGTREKRQCEAWKAGASGQTLRLQLSKEINAESHMSSPNVFEILMRCSRRTKGEAQRAQKTHTSEF
jgi:ATP sulfurylase